MLKFTSAVVLSALTLLSAAGAEWKAIRESSAPEKGERIEITADGKPLARFIFGEGQLKPYLHLFGEEGELLTEWSPDQQFSHHRGIYIGWNRIESELGRSDLWHLRSGERMVVKSISTDVNVGKENNATITAEIEWHGARPDASGSSLLLNETRKLVISKSDDKKTQVDASFELKPVRKLALGGDLQHSGIHFRASHKLGQRENETRYVWEPDLPGAGGKVVSDELKWARLIFPLENRWYSATHLNAPTNPTTELSWRGYGRFGYFFKKELEKGEELNLQYRFITQPASGAPSKEDLKEHREDCGREYEKFLRDLRKGT